jgi:hypothetical protein
MKSANCPLGATAGARTGVPPPLMLPADVQRVLKLLAVGAGFFCGCWIGASWKPGDAGHADVVLPLVGKYLPLVGGPIVLWRRPAERD